MNAVGLLGDTEHALERRDSKRVAICFAGGLICELFKRDGHCH